MLGRNLAIPFAGDAGLIPGFTAATARRARLAEWDIHRHRNAPERLLRAQLDFGGKLRRDGHSEEGGAHTVEDAGHRREIDRDLVVEPSAPAGVLRLAQDGVVRPSSLRIAENL